MSRLHHCRMKKIFRSQNTTEFQSIYIQCCLKNKWVYIVYLALHHWFNANHKMANCTPTSSLGVRGEKKLLIIVSTRGPWAYRHKCAKKENFRLLDPRPSAYDQITAVHNGTCFVWYSFNGRRSTCYVCSPFQTMLSCLVSKIKVSKWCEKVLIFKQIVLGSNCLLFLKGMW